MQSFRPDTLLLFAQKNKNKKGAIVESCDHDIDPQGTIMPIFFMHGFTGTAQNAKKLFDVLYEPGNAAFPQYFCSIPLFENTTGTSLERQAAAVATYIRKKAALLRDPTTQALLPYQVVGFSLGGVIMRMVIQRMDAHRAVNFVALGSPLAGLHLTADKVAKASRALGRFQALGARAASKVFQWGFDRIQKYVSPVALSKNPFLPYSRCDLLWRLDGYQGKTESDAHYRQRFLRQHENWGRLLTVTLVATEKDNVCIPYQSAHFGFFKRNNATHVEPWYNRRVGRYLGLHELARDGNLALWTYKGRRQAEAHFEFVRNAEVIKHYLVPALMTTNFTLLSEEAPGRHQCTRDDQCAAAEICHHQTLTCVVECEEISRRDGCQTQPQCRWIPQWSSAPCRTHCTSATDCSANEVCKRALKSKETKQKMCWRQCSESSDCAIGETCRIVGSSVVPLCVSS